MSTEDTTKFIPPKSWGNGDYEEPTPSCMEKTFKVCDKIHSSCGIKYDRMAPTIVGGMFIAYDSPSKAKSLFIEVYNEDLEVGYLINDNSKKEIIKSGEIVGDDFNYNEIIEYIV